MRITAILRKIDVSFAVKNVQGLESGATSREIAGLFQSVARFEEGELECYIGQCDMPEERGRMNRLRSDLGNRAMALDMISPRLRPFTA